MSADAALLAPYRSQVAADVERLLSGLEFSHAELLRLAWSSADDSLAAPSLCLLAGEVIGGDSKPALPLAISLALLEASTRAFQDVALDDEALVSGLQSEWGMPRLLNVGDAFFVLAQQSVLRLDEHSLDAAARFDAVAARCWHALESGEPLKPVLVSGAIVLGAGASSRKRGLDINIGTVEEVIAALDLSGEPKRRLLDAAHFALIG
jgi:hypothetical protein